MSALGTGTPITTSAIQAWRHRIEAHNAQTMRARAGREVPDLWAGIADNFRDDARRTGDPIVTYVVPWLGPDSTVLDVGGGAGRYALPFALHSRHVTNVEPSPAMADAFNDSAKQAGIENVSVVAESWEEAKVEPHDVAFCANVVYGVADIEPFVRKLNASAKEIAAIVVYMDAPLAMMSALWQAVHQERRIDLPALPELLPVLWEMDIFPNVQMFPPLARPGAPNMEMATAVARHFLYIEAGSEKDERLKEVAEEMAVRAADGTYSLRAAQTRPQGIVWWRTAAA